MSTLINRRAIEANVGRKPCKRKELQMLTQQQIEAIILYHLYGESEAAAKRFRDAVSTAAKEIAAQQSVQPTEPTCPECGSELEYWSCAKIKCGSHV